MAKRVKRVHKSQSYYGQIYTLFPKSQHGMASQIARLIVLSEDLKIEKLGAFREKKTFLDFFKNPDYRRHYFVRRAMLTFKELHTVLKQLEVDDDFRRVKVKMSAEHKARWKQAVRYLNDNAEAIRAARNVTGGHFSNSAGKYVVDELSTDLHGKVEVVWKGDNVHRINLHFAYDLVTLGLIEPRATGQTVSEYITKFLGILHGAFPHAERVMQAVTETYIIPKFRGTY